MDGLVKSQVPHERSLLALFKSSPSSSSLSSSFSSSWTSEVVLQIQTESKVRRECGPNDVADLRSEQTLSHITENEEIQGVGFINGIVGRIGMEWKDLEKRFDQVARTESGAEPAVTWSEFGFCIGENSKLKSTVHYHFVSRPQIQ